ncbi:MAG: gas vesicle protein K [Planctomycetota bacterium]|nr:gas vesicle protein K [Planctomycetota bacterium]
MSEAAPHPAIAEAPPLVSGDACHLAPEVSAAARRTGQRVTLDPDNVRNGLGQLVLTVVRLLHELLERQAIRRIEAGSLTDKQIEDVGRTLMRQTEEIERLAEEFGVKAGELDLDLGPLGRLF